MTVLLGCCGYRCDQCPAYKANLRTHADRVKVSEDYRKYYDYEIEPENVDCDGCLHTREAPNPNCPVRPCAFGRGVQTCAECDDFGCAKLQQTMNAIKPIAAKHAQNMSAEEYDRYIRPFVTEERLEKLRRSPNAE
ncbi:MAG: DUF3795 domain-containing protein [Phycisphaerae bacterium]|nr:DUF3795 domain-containing protein [Phycisphaerae bacterium]